MELSTSNLGFVMQSNLDGGDVQPFFNHTEDCSCPFRPNIQPVFTIDNTEPQSPVVYWVGADGELYIADIEGCICSLVLGAGTEHGLPPTSLTTDKSNIYWSNMATGKIHFADKTTNPEDLFVMVSFYVLIILLIIRNFIYFFYTACALKEKRKKIMKIVNNH